MKIFESYWGLGSHNRQCDFIGRNVKFLKKRQVTVDPEISRRQHSRRYTFMVGFEELRVCKKMFIETLSISERIVNTVYKKLEYSHVILADGRGTPKIVHIRFQKK